MPTLKHARHLVLALTPTLVGLWAFAFAHPSSVPYVNSQAHTSQVLLTATNLFTVHLPLVLRPQPPEVPPTPVPSPEPGPSDLLNGDFEGSTCRDTLNGSVYAEISVPEHWVAFWKEEEGYGRPEMGVIPDSPPYLDPPRVHAGEKALKWFTFYRTGDAGVLQQVSAEVGRRYRAQGSVHAWYSQRDDPHVSQWVDSKTGIVYPILDGDPGMESMIGIDSTGGTDPWASSVIWSRAHIYDQFDQISVQATARAEKITIFARTCTLYPFKHCDAYWDSLSLQRVD